MASSEWSGPEKAPVRVKATIEYLGTSYAGWQAQPDRPTVQVEIEHAIRVATGVASRVRGAGRTDAGVHAQGQVAAFDVPDDTDLYRLRSSLNGITPRDIAVLNLEPAASSFDPRRQARLRSYRYTIVSGRPPSPLLADRSWYVAPNLDLQLLDRIGRAVVGRHDFHAFRAADCEAATSLREVASSVWARDGGVYTYAISANAFLKHMVRILVGSMVDVALGKLAERDFLRLLGGGQRPEAGRTAPAAGLTLVSVEY